MGTPPPGSHRLDTERLPDHVDRLFRAALAFTGSREDAEDLVQETFAQVLRRPRFVRHDNDLAYLIRTLRNTWLRMRTKRTPRDAVEIEEEEWRIEDPRSPDPHAVAEAHQLLAALAELPEAFRDVVVAVDVAGLSYQEAARALRTREGTIMSRLYRGREKLAATLREE